MSNQPIDISFVTVSYNSAELIIPCVKSVLALKGAKEIFVIDNHSVDGSADLVRATFPQIDLVANKENIGFGAANNLVLSRCRGRYVFFLNPDTQIRSGSLEALVRFMDDHPQIGLCGPRIIQPDGTIQWSVCDHYPGYHCATSELKDLKGSIACVLGAAMITRTDLVRQMGGFDEEFFLYGEDQDLCLRIRKAGYEIGYFDDFVLMHLGGQSENRSDPAEIWNRKISAEYLFYRKHYSGDTIPRIARRDLLKSVWRLMTIRLLLPFNNSEASRDKLSKYRATCDIARANIQRREAIPANDAPLPPS